MLFAHLKRVLNLTPLRLRGPTGARTSSSSPPSPQNLRSWPSCGRVAVCNETRDAGLRVRRPAGSAGWAAQVITPRPLLTGSADD